MRRFALLALLLAGTALALAPGAGGGGGHAAAGDRDAAAAGGRLVLAVIGTERSASAVHGERVVVADPRTGRVQSRRLPGGTLCHGPLIAAGDRVIYTGYRGSRAMPMSLPLTLTGAPSPLGPADTIETRRALALWEGRTAGPLRGGRNAWVVAAGGPRFAWCSGRCRSVRVRTPAGERTFRSPLQLRITGAGGSFSPDGRRLALPVAQGRRTRAAVIDLRTGEWSMVPGVALSVYGAMAWSSTGDRLYLAVAGGGLRAWLPRAPRSEHVPVDPGGTVMSISVAP